MMKRIFCILLILAMVFTMAACGNKPSAQNTDEEEIMSPTQTLDAFLKAFKARDADKLNEFYEGESDDLIFWKDLEDPALSGLMDKMMEKLLDFDYALSNEKIDGKTATVDVNFTTYDIGGILTDIFSSMATDFKTFAIMGLSPEELEAEINEIITEKFEEYSKKAKKERIVSVPVKLVMINGRWLVKDISSTDEIVDALSGGLTEFAENIGDIFG